MLHAGDVINGAEGKATANLNGQVVDLFYLKNLEATFEKVKTEVRVLGSRAVHHKAGGWSGSGSFDLYYMSPVFRKLALDYAKTGKDLYFTITVVNEDPGSTVGRQTTALYQCNLDNTILAKLDAETEALDESIDFTFEDFDFIDQFGNPISQ